MNREKIFLTLDQLKTTLNLEDEFNKFKTNLNDSEIVVSFPGVFFFIGEHAVIYGQPALYMSIPLYVFAGIKKSGAKGINIEMWQIDLEGKFFKKFKWENNQREELQRYIEDVFRRESIEPEYSIFALLQIPPRCGLNSSGAFSAGVSVLLGMLKGYISQEKVNNWQNTRDLSVLKKDKEFNKTFEIAWEIDWVMQNGSSGIGPFTSLIGVRGEPIVYFLTSEVSEEQKPEWSACLLSELYGEDEMKWLKKACIALIYSGRSAATKKAFDIVREESYKASQTIPLFSKQLLSKQPEILEKIKEIATPLQSILISGIKENKEYYKETKIDIDKFISELKEKKKEYKDIHEYILSKIYSVLGGFSLICISNFKTSCNKKYVVSMMNVYQNVLDSLGLSTSEINEICKKFHQEEIGAKLTGSGTGGDVVVFSDIPGKINKIKRIIRENDYVVHFASWKGKREYEPIQKCVKYLVTSHDLRESEKDEAYIGVITKKLPESPEYKDKGEFSEDAGKTQRNILEDIKQIIKIAGEENITLDVIVLPEYSFPPEKDGHHWEIREKLKEITKENELIIIAGSYLSKLSEDICLIFVPNHDEPFKVPKLNKSPIDPDFLKEGDGIHIFENSRIGDFCVIVCYDALSKEIPKYIRDCYRRGKCFTLFIVSCTPAIKEFEKTCELLALPAWKSRKEYDSDLGLTAHVILADSFRGSSYYAAPVKKDSRTPKEKVCIPAVEKNSFYIYKILVKEMGKARGSERSSIFYAIDAS